MIHWLNVQNSKETSPAGSEPGNPATLVRKMAGCRENCRASNASLMAATVNNDATCAGLSAGLVVWRDLSRATAAAAMVGTSLSLTIDVANLAPTVLAL